MTSTPAAVLAMGALMIALLGLAHRAVADSDEDSAATPKTPVELGAIGWLRDHDAAFTKARESKRPVLLLFQEVPG